jgi:hypothetical protein
MVNKLSEVSQLHFVFHIQVVMRSEPPPQVVISPLRVARIMVWSKNGGIHPTARTVFNLHREER